ncbi:hypothetical protein CORC01_09467 [Colletotrichum orchidophilum]|uniref:Uncharacterized protein n=1 Tax=Colletotrichum orchidophilum TaxID=1209926 RepID=A0A1G4B1H0_9PEZI|nr:uncharacterized protein CORC01_09467 [Colletotrichum orchidophilum]OHE95206.1 hypothetical protein CORC01_09467 [Colletotrichum orchidophilum]
MYSSKPLNLKRLHHDDKHKEDGEGDETDPDAGSDQSNEDDDNIAATEENEENEDNNDIKGNIYGKDKDGSRDDEK